MRKHKLVACLLASALMITSCGGNGGTDKKTDVTTQTEAVTETEAVSEPTQDTANEATSIDRSSLNPFLSQGEEISEGPTFSIIDDKAYCDAPVFNDYYEGEVHSFCRLAQGLIMYAEQEKTDLDDDGLLDYMLKEKLQGYYYEHLENSDSVSEYEITSQEQVEKGSLTCTHYVGKLTGESEFSDTKRNYSFEAYCFNFAGYPCFAGAIVNEADGSDDEAFLEQTKKDLSNNIDRMLLTISSTED